MSVDISFASGSVRRLRQKSFTAPVASCAFVRRAPIFGAETQPLFAGRSRATLPASLYIREYHRHPGVTLVKDSVRCERRMLLVFLLLFLPLLTATETTQTTVMQNASKLQLEEPENPVDWISDGIVNAVDTILPVSRSSVEARRKKKKLKLNRYLIPLVVGFMLIKSILLPIALKTLAILSGKAVVLSLMSLILAAIVGLKKVAQSHSGGGYEVVNVPYGKYRRQDMLDMADSTSMESEPYKFYRERRKKK
ncbi:protein Osi13 isoform X1 [Lasioglossum baleicum]|uniref:protein Osi13 isoform X1 n=2 Tax=Lasioglossum baleicum TaxID=434251 RepID=UPI003FCCD2FA